MEVKHGATFWSHSRGAMIRWLVVNLMVGSGSMLMLVNGAFAQQATNAPASSPPPSRGFFGTLGQAYVDEFRPAPSDEAEPPRRALPAPLDSPPFPSSEWQGFPLIGGRLDYIDSRPVAALVYQRKKHFINVFVWPAHSERASPATKVERQGYDLFHWTKGGMNYWVVSDLEQGDLRNFVDMLQTGAPGKS